MRSLMLGLACGLMLTASAYAQSSSVTVGQNGQLQGSTSVPGLPPMSVTAGNGQVTTSGGPRSGQGGRSVTVRSRDGSSSASSWTSGGGSSSVAASGSPGSTITYDRGGGRHGEVDDRLGDPRPRGGPAVATHRAHWSRHTRRHRRHHHRG